MNSFYSKWVFHFEKLPIQEYIFKFAERGPLPKIRNIQQFSTWTQLYYLILFNWPRHITDTHAHARSFILPQYLLRSINKSYWNTVYCDKRKYIASWKQINSKVTAINLLKCRIFVIENTHILKASKIHVKHVL